MPLRPTPDAMRERAFAVLGERVAGARVLDLYAGTGAISFEALSRGASAVVLVERHRAAAAIIRANMQALQVDRQQARLLVRPVLAALSELVRRQEPFQLLWADPPFEEWSGGLQAILRAVSLGLLAPGAITCFECPAEAEVDLDETAGLRLDRDLRGGASRVLLLHHTGLRSSVE